MLKNFKVHRSLIKLTEDIAINDNLYDQEILFKFLDRNVFKLRTKEVASLKFHYRNQFVEETT